MLTSQVQINGFRRRRRRARKWRDDAQWNVYFSRRDDDIGAGKYSTINARRYLKQSARLSTNNGTLRDIRLIESRVTWLKLEPTTERPPLKQQLLSRLLTPKKVHVVASVFLFSTLCLLYSTRAQYNTDFCLRYSCVLIIITVIVVPYGSYVRDRFSLSLLFLFVFYELKIHYFRRYVKDLIDNCNCLWSTVKNLHVFV